MKRTRSLRAYADGPVRRSPDPDATGTEPQRGPPDRAEPRRAEADHAEADRIEPQRTAPPRARPQRRRTSELRIEPQPAPAREAPTPIVPTEPPPLRPAGQETLHSAVRRIGHKSSGRHVHRGIGAKLSDWVSRQLQQLFGSD